MPLSWNEIKSRALAFTNEWKDEVSEDAEAKSFWDDFFNVFGISRRRVATFEQQVRLTSRDLTHAYGRQAPNPSPKERGTNPTAGVSPKERGMTGYIDLLWKGVILIEHKSRGKDLAKAYGQAKDYFPGLKEKELPRYILVSDFERFNLYDLEEGTQQDFTVHQLVDNVHLFGFIAGYQKRTYKEQDPVNIEAAELMGRLHDKLKAIGYEGHSLELYLVRLVFLLFADDTNIFEKGIFYDYLDLKTNEDGSDLAAHIAQLFEVLNTPKDKRLRNLDETLDAFPYVNGKLFEEHLPIAGFDSEMRKILMDCCLLNWGKISPAIFGSLFQSVMDAKARRNLGAHYTSEKNILKLIKPLFLDELYEEFNKVKDNKAKLQKLHEKISRLRFLDPACGCGNFLIIAYRELRLLEMEIVKLLLKGQTVTDIGYYFLLDVDRFYGIEYEEFPAQIAQVAMWLIDHQMNMKASETFGEYYVRLPLRKSATIVHGNALRIDWQSLIDPLPWEKGEAKYDYILGNPPFIGHQVRNKGQMDDMSLIFGDTNKAGRLDYVAAWYLRAAQYMKAYNVIATSETRQSTNLTKTAFVSTNSIIQGEQAEILWSELFNNYGISIHFAHRTFKWSNEARGNAVVTVVIIGFGNFDVSDKTVFEYQSLLGEPLAVKVKNINGYLSEGKNIFIQSRSKAIHHYPLITKGSQATDGGNLFLTESERQQIVLDEPAAEPYIKPFVGAEEFLHGQKRYCLWLKDVSPEKLAHLKSVRHRLDLVKMERLKSPTASVREFSRFPYLFTQDRQPISNYLVIPRHSSELRDYIPLGYLTPETIVGDANTIIPDATLFVFGVLQSRMHNVWIKTVCGRLENRIRYSSAVYNNYPFPDTTNIKSKEAVEKAAQAVLYARAQFPDASLADLYDPNTMPPVLMYFNTARRQSF